ncbi:DUF448 domain-containing protein [Helicobacter brantae]|uniref:DUF448 domain-containing protein n=1 Tax=Helicobacter brantae TaxID=375927 RepID=A0A3D8J3K5_9HELI|nr:DUF448 domain-containing protein [Helicobacter brantae]RDU71735.1 DUF448 domain-containing protein [Helicobacter brantae]
MLEVKIYNSFKFASLKTQRMCVVCRQKYLQSTMMRLCVKNEKIEVFCGFGRSFYLCKECADKPKSVERILKSRKLNTQENQIQLKEIITLWQYQSKNLH